MARLPQARDVVHPVLLASVARIPPNRATRLHAAWFDLLDRAIETDRLMAAFGIVVGRPGRGLADLVRGVRTVYPTADEWLLMSAADLAADLGLAPPAARRLVGAREVLAELLPAVHRVDERDRVVVATMWLAHTMAQVAGAVTVGDVGVVVDADRRPFLTGRRRGATIGPFVTDARAPADVPSR